MKTPKRITKRTVAGLVDAELRARNLQDEIGFDSEGIHEEEETWIVPVWPMTTIGTEYRYYQCLADVESDLEDKHGVYTMLLPTIQSLRETG